MGWEAHICVRLGGGLLSCTFSVSGSHTCRENRSKCLKPMRLRKSFGDMGGVGGVALELE